MNLPAVGRDGPARERYMVRPDAGDPSEADHVLDAAQARQLVLAHRRAAVRRRLDAGVEPDELAARFKPPEQVGQVVGLGGRLQVERHALDHPG